MSTGPKNERKRARMAAVISAVAVVSVGLWFGAVASAQRDEQAQAKLKLDLSAQRALSGRMGPGRRFASVSTSGSRRRTAATFSSCIWPRSSSISSAWRCALARLT